MHSRLILQRFNFDSGHYSSQPTYSPLLFRIQLSPVGHVRAVALHRARLVSGESSPRYGRRLQRSCFWCRTGVVRAGRGPRSHDSTPTAPQPQHSRVLSCTTIPPGKSGEIGQQNGRTLLFQREEPKSATLEPTSRIFASPPFYPFLFPSSARNERQKRAEES